MRWPIALALCAGCGRLGFDALAGGDASGGDAVTDTPAADAPPDAPPPCTGPFGAPELIANVSSPADEWGAHLSDDRLELYFGSNRGGTFDVYVATRASATEPFGTPVVAFSSGDDDDNPFLEADGRTLWFDRTGTLSVMTRPDRMSPWGPPTVVALDSVDSDVGASLSADGLRLYFASNRTGGAGSYDLWFATRANTTVEFANPVRFATLASGGFECCPTVVAGGAQLLYTSDQIGTNFAIATVALDAAGLPTGAPTVVAEIDTINTEVDAFMTRDGTVLGFSSNRPGGPGNQDLYWMERSCP